MSSSTRRIKRLEDIPFELQLEIFKRLPVKSLIQFRSVSKAWKAVIDSSDFIARYKSLKQHLLVSEHSVVYEQVFCSYADDDDFPQPPSVLTDPQFSEWLRNYRVIGYSNGLVCLFSYLNGLAVLYNPSIRKTVSVIVPNLGNQMYETCIGFGVCRETNDPKIVKVAYIRREIIKREVDMGSISCVPWQVEVFTLSTRAWRSPYGNLPRKSIRFYRRPVSVDGFIYWVATENISRDGEYMDSNLIVSFDIKSEEFKEINLPDSLAFTDDYIYISELSNSLVVIKCEKNVNDPDHPVNVVWKMEGGGVFNTLFSVNVSTRHASILGFRKSGAPIIECLCDEDEWGQLVAYEPTSKHVDKFYHHHSWSHVHVYPYVETLLLLDQPDLMVYNDI